MKSNMKTTVSFGDDGGIRVVNQKIGAPHDKCVQDLELLHGALAAGGAVLVDDQDLAPDEQPAMNLGRVSEGVGQEPARRRIRRQTGTQVPVCVEK